VPLSADRPLSAKRESKRLDFKAEFDVNSKGDWCEVIKDIVAMANAGGGAIVFGADNKGRPTGCDCSAILATDPAVVTDKIFSYTGSHFATFEMVKGKKRGKTLAILRVGPARIPLVFTKPGTYAIDEKNQKNAFSVGAVYFRHGAKSEPATSLDLEEVIDRRLEEVRKQWIGKVRKVIEAPSGSTVSVLPPEVRQSNSPNAVPVRLVADPSAQGFKLLDLDTFFPYRQKELIVEVVKRLPKGVTFNSFDVQVLRRVYPELETDQYSHEPHFGSRQYNQDAVAWIIAAFKGNPKVFKRARARYRKRDA
jgi:hypothetical protein